MVAGFVGGGNSRTRPTDRPNSIFARDTRRIGDPAFLHTVVFHAGVAADRGAPHQAIVSGRVEPCRRMHQRAIVVDHDIAGVPVVGVGEARLGEMRHELVEQRRAGAVRTGRHAGEGSVDPVHLACFAQIERGLPGHRVDPHDGLALRPLVRLEAVRRLARPHRRFRAPGIGHDVDAHEALDARLQCRRQGLVGRGAVGVERLPLPLGRRGHGIEERQVGRRPPEALVGMPAPAVREPGRQAAIGGARRVRVRRRHLVGRRHVRDDEDFGHALVQLGLLRQGLVIILDLGTEQTAQPHQQLGLFGYPLHRRHQQQALRGVERTRQQLGLGLRRGDRRAGVGRAREARDATETRARQGPELEAAVCYRVRHSLSAS